MDNSLNDLVTLLLTYLGIIVAVGLIWTVLVIVANWRIFTKAGEAGWKSIIPVYNGYIGYKIAWKPAMFWVTVVVTCISSYCYSSAFTNATVSEGSASNPMLTVAFIAMLVGSILGILFNYKLAKAFGKGIGFTLGLLFLNPIFLMILGFGGARYQGADQ